MSYEKTGYLHQNFQMFHLKDQTGRTFQFHYHDFHKILILLNGDITYCIEGRSYILKPNDIVFVPAGEVHRPMIAKDTVYERIIIYISREFLESYQDESTDLSLCLKQVHENQTHVLRLHSFINSKPGMICRELEHALSDYDYGNGLYRELLFLEFMLHLNRAYLHHGIDYISDNTGSKIPAIVDYLNTHLKDEINVDSIADAFYLSRYHLMHSFKKETGYTIGSYLSTKRLLLAREYLNNGMNATEACYECGFHNYSTFFRAYKKQFGHSPTILQSHS